MRLAVEVEDVFRVYSTDEGTAAALQGLSLTVHEGEVVAVLGPSGSGKTTLLRILAGLDRPSAGRVRVAGIDLRRLRGRGLDRYRSRQLGYADQRYGQALAPELTAAELVSLRLALAGESSREQRRRTAELLAQVGLDDRAGAYPHELSGGEQQRLAIGRALLGDPKLLIMDEPSEGLAPTVIEVMVETLRKLEEEGLAILLIEQNLGVATGVAERQLIMVGGELAHETTASQLSSDSELQRRYLGVEPLAS